MTQSTMLYISKKTTTAFATVDIPSTLETYVEVNKIFILDQSAPTAQIVVYSHNQASEACVQRQAPAFKQKHKAIVKTIVKYAKI